MRFEITLLIGLCLAFPSCAKPVASTATVAAPAKPQVAEIKIAPPKDQNFVVYDPLAGWARILTDYVDEKGAVDFAELKEDHDDLDLWVAWVAEAGPKLKPDRYKTKEEVASFFANAYTGLAMYCAVTSEVQPKDSARFHSGVLFMVDGEWMNLDAIGKRAREAWGDPGIYFVLNDMTRTAPRLLRKPLLSERIANQITGAVREFFEDGTRVRVDAGRKVVAFPAMLQTHRTEFESKGATLLAYANAVRTQKIPLDYKIEFLPANATRNDQARATAP